VTDAEQLADLIRERQPCVVLTGAGVSTESGIPDFRSATGIWADVDPMEVASIFAFLRDPEAVWDFYARRVSIVSDARPNAAHLALAELERRGLVAALVTQNIDTLHQQAGSHEVVEVHGSIRTASCYRCGVRATIGQALARLPLPTCESCGGNLKPDVVMFGEAMPEGETARAFALEAGLLLVVGSSLEVYPIAGLPEETLAAGGSLAIVNKGPTPYDGTAALKIDASAGETLAAVLEAV
jgi:NAD-dependent protein deacetylase/lipoamidase